MAEPKHPAEATKRVPSIGAEIAHMSSTRIGDGFPLAPPQPVAPASGYIANAEAVIAWATSENRKPAMHAFTAGPERQAAYWIEAAEARARQDYQRLLDKHNALHFNARAARDRVKALEAERDRLLADMRLIAATDPVDAMLDPDRAVRIAKAAIAAAETKEMP